MRTDTAIVTMLVASFAACSPTTEEAAPAFGAGENVSPFAIGLLQAASLRDAAFAPANDNMTLAINVTKADVDALLTAAGLATDVLQLSVQPLIVRTPDRVLLFDTGNGPSGMLSASMATAGVEPAEVVFPRLRLEGSPGEDADRRGVHRSLLHEIDVFQQHRLRPLLRVVIAAEPYVGG